MSLIKSEGNIWQYVKRNIQQRSFLDLDLLNAKTLRTVRFIILFTLSRFLWGIIMFKTTSSSFSFPGRLRKVCQTTRLVNIPQSASYRQKHGTICRHYLLPQIRNKRLCKTGDFNTSATFHLPFFLNFGFASWIKWERVSNLPSSRLWAFSCCLEKVVEMIYF